MVYDELGSFKELIWDAKRVYGEPKWHLFIIIIILGT